MISLEKLTKSKKKDFKINANKLVQCLGGKDNILEYEFNKSRFIVNLKDFQYILSSVKCNGHVIFFCVYLYLNIKHTFKTQK